MTIAQDPFYFSPPQSSPDELSAQMQFDEDSKDDLFDTQDFAASNDAVSMSSGKPKKPSSSFNRKGPDAADKRATHNAIERARRENLNGRFMTLAEALPSMADVKRPSKSIIVNKALEFVYEAQLKENALVKENNDLRREVDSLRAQLGLPPLPPPAPLPGTGKGSTNGKKNKATRPALVKQATNKSFNLTPPDNVSDEINAAMGLGSSPNSDQSTSESPSSATGTSPGVAATSFMPMFSPMSETGSLAPSDSPSSMSSFVSISPFMPGATASVAPTSTVMPSQLGFVPHHAHPHPATLLSPQQSMLLAVQYQQQVQQQHNAHINELYGTLAATQQQPSHANMGGLPWAAFTHQHADHYAMT